MKLRALSLFIAAAALAFGQTRQRSPVAADTVEFSASSISYSDGDMRSNQTRAQLAALREQRDALLATYTAKHEKVQAVEAQMGALESTLAAAPKTVHLKGNVEIRTDTMTLTADEAYYDQATGELTAMGTVRVKPISK